MNETFPWLYLNSVLAYKAYDKWLSAADGRTDLHLAGFKLTDRQMFWLTSANVFAIKDHNIKGTNNGPFSKIHNKYLHVTFKHDPNFRKDYNCKDMTEAETKLYDKYLEELSIARANEAK